MRIPHLRAGCAPTGSGWCSTRDLAGQCRLGSKLGTMRGRDSSTARSVLVDLRRGEAGAAGDCGRWSARDGWGPDAERDTRANRRRRRGQVAPHLNYDRDGGGGGPRCPRDFFVETEAVPQGSPGAIDGRESDGYASYFMINCTRSFIGLEGTGSNGSGPRKRVGAPESSTRPVDAEPAELRRYPAADVPRLRWSGAAARRPHVPQSARSGPRRADRGRQRSPGQRGRYHQQDGDQFRIQWVEWPIAVTGIASCR